MNKHRYCIIGKYGRLIMHRHNDKEELIERCKRLHAIFGDDLGVWDNALGEVVWSLESKERA